MKYLKDQSTRQLFQQYSELHADEQVWKAARILIRGCFLSQIKSQGAVSIRKTVLPGMTIPMLKIRRPNGRLIFNMEIAIRR